MSPVPTISPALRRRGLAAAAATAGAGAIVALLAMSSATPTSVAALAPVAGSATAAAAAVPEAESLTAARSVPRATYTRLRPTAERAATNPKAGKAATHAAPAAKSCAGMSSTADAFLQHVYAAHLEASPGQQVADITDVDQYVTTHTVMLENMLEPLIGGGGSALDAFLQHVYAAHLEASPGQQVADIADIDQYVTTHTVMVENMLEPLLGGSC